ncbi:MAG: tetratricopeptide repeat protein [Planctomycetes bacterium]|nr:tetratricopeptide repeat protein [Planctomycetota bacterium]
MIVTPAHDCKSYAANVTPYVFLLIVTVTVPYLNSLTNGFVWLDRPEILEGRLLIDSWSELIHVAWYDDNNYSGYHRPIYNAIHSFDFLIWKENPFGYHLSSVVLHMLNVILLYYLLSNVTSRVRISFYVALFWGLHPVNTAAVSLIHSKADLLVTFYSLGTFIVSFLSVHRDRNTMAARCLPVLAGILYLLALLSKETALVCPLVLMVILLPREKKSDVCAAARNSYVLLLAVFGIVTVAYILHRLLLVSFDTPENKMPLLDRMLTVIPVYVGYITRSLSTIELTTNDAVLIWRHYGMIFPITLLLFVIVLAVQILVAVKNRECLPGILWFNLYLLPVAQVFPILNFRADRFLYIPSIGFIWATVVFVENMVARFRRKNGGVIFRSLQLLVLVIAGYFSIRIWERNKDFEHDDVFFEDVAGKYPECREAHSFLALEYLSRDDLDRAEDAFQKALAKDDRYYSYVNYDDVEGNYAVLLLRKRKYQEAYEMLRRLLARVPDANLEVYFNIGVCCFKIGKYGDAYGYLRRYLEAMPDNPDALFLLGKSSIALGRLQDAQNAFKQYLKVVPSAGDRGYVEQLLLRLEEVDAASP